MAQFQRHLYHPYTDYDQSLDEGFVSSVKEKLGLAPKKSNFRRFVDHLKANKGRIAARAAGMLGGHLLYNKATGRGYWDDWQYGNTVDRIRRMGVSIGGAELGEKLYNRFHK